MAEMLLSLQIPALADDAPRRLIYRPLELKLESEGGLKVVRNSFNDVLNYQQFDCRRCEEFKGIDIQAETNITSNREYKNYQDQRRMRQDRQGHQDQTHLRLDQTQWLVQAYMQRTRQIREEDEILPYGQNGLLGVLKGEVDRKSAEKMKIMVCVTMFKEPLSQLQKTIDGITSNLRSLMEVGYASHQIGIFVMFDGIEHLHNDFDENGGSYHDNIIPYFKTHMDDLFGIKEVKTLDYQYKNYLKHKKRMNDYKPENIKAFRNDKNLLMKKYKKHEAEIQRTIKHLKGEGCNPALLYLEGPILEAMEHLYKLSKKYIAARESTAWVYQSRYQCTVETLQDGIMVKQSFFLPIFYVFKFRNGQKLSSHCWFFRGFCQEYQPDYCVLLDCGAIPDPNAITKLVMSMECDPQLGGVCGHMRIEEEEEVESIQYPMDLITRILNTWVFSIQKCQSCEYDIGHVLDKQFESCMNYVHVLPGAFSAYRYEAFTRSYKNLDSQDLQNTDVLKQYLRQVIDPHYEFQNIQEANMFLAEDRVLCLLLFCNGYTLRYIPDSFVFVDAQKTLIELLWQRRRWINGSWFALNYVVDHYLEPLEKSTHSFCAKKLFQFSIIQARIGQLSQYMIPTFQIVWLYMILEHMVQLESEIANSVIKSVTMCLYIILLLMLIFLSLTYNQPILNKLKNKDKTSAVKEAEAVEQYYFSKFYGISTILGFISLGTVAYTIYILIKEIILEFRLDDFVELPDVPQSYYFLLIVLSFAATALPFIINLLGLGLCGSSKSVLNIMVNIVHYFYYQPTYTHLFMVYSFCRIDDLSWGTKGLTADGNEKKITQDKHQYKFYFLIKWILTNTIVSTAMLMLLQMRVMLLPQFAILAVSVLISLLAIFKGLLSFFYHFIALGHKKKRSEHMDKQKLQNYRVIGQEVPQVEEEKLQNRPSDPIQRSIAYNEKLENYFNVTKRDHDHTFVN